MLEINGGVGPYNSNTRDGYSRNAAHNVMQHDKEVKQKSVCNLNEIEFENIKYSLLQNSSADEYVKDAKVFSDESMKALTNNGKVSKEEFIPTSTPKAMKKMLNKFFKGVDLNKDGYIDNNENTAVVLAMDSVTISDDFKSVKVGTPDGYIDGKNKQNVDNYIMNVPEKAIKLLTNISKTFNLS